MSNRYSNEDAVKRIPNRFELVLIAAQRVRELRRGHKSLINSDTGPGLTALQEIAEGHVGHERLLRVGDRPSTTQKSR